MITSQYIYNFLDTERAKTWHPLLSTVRIFFIFFFYTFLQKGMVKTSGKV